MREIHNKESRKLKKVSLLKNRLQKPGVEALALQPASPKFHSPEETLYMLEKGKNSDEIFSFDKSSSNFKQKGGKSSPISSRKSPFYKANSRGLTSRGDNSSPRNLLFDSFAPEEKKLEKIREGLNSQKQDNGLIERRREGCGAKKSMSFRSKSGNSAKESMSSSCPTESRVSLIEYEFKGGKVKVIDAEQILPKKKSPKKKFSLGLKRTSSFSHRDVSGSEEKKNGVLEKENSNVSELKFSSKTYKSQERIKSNDLDEAFDAEMDEIEDQETQDQIDYKIKFSVGESERLKEESELLSGSNKGETDKEEVIENEKNVKGKKNDFEDDKLSRLSLKSYESGVSKSRISHISNDKVIPPSKSPKKMKMEKEEQEENEKEKTMENKTSKASFGLNHYPKSIFFRMDQNHKKHKKEAKSVPKFFFKNRDEVEDKLKEIKGKENRDNCEVEKTQEEEESTPKKRMRAKSHNFMDASDEERRPSISDVIVEENFELLESPTSNMRIPIEESMTSDSELSHSSELSSSIEEIEVRLPVRIKPASGTEIVEVCEAEKKEIEDELEQRKKVKKNWKDLERPTIVIGFVENYCVIKKTAKKINKEKVDKASDVGNVNYMRYMRRLMISNSLKKEAELSKPLDCSKIVKKNFRAGKMEAGDIKDLGSRGDPDGILLFNKILLDETQEIVKEFFEKIERRRNHKYPVSLPSQINTNIPDRVNTCTAQKSVLAKKIKISNNSTKPLFKSLRNKSAKMTIPDKQSISNPEKNMKRAILKSIIPKIQITLPKTSMVSYMDTFKQKGIRDIPTNQETPERKIKLVSFEAKNRRKIAEICAESFVNEILTRAKQDIESAKESADEFVGSSMRKAKGEIERSIITKASEKFIKAIFDSSFDCLYANIPKKSTGCKIRVPLSSQETKLGNIKTSKNGEKIIFGECGSAILIAKSNSKRRMPFSDHKDKMGNIDHDQNYLKIVLQSLDDYEVKHQQEIVRECELFVEEFFQKKLKKKLQKAIEQRKMAKTVKTKIQKNKKFRRLRSNSVCLLQKRALDVSKMVEVANSVNKSEKIEIPKRLESKVLINRAVF